MNDSEYMSFDSVIIICGLYFAVDFHAQSMFWYVYLCKLNLCENGSKEDNWVEDAPGM